MRPKRLFWQIFPSYLFIILLSLIAVTWYASGSWRGFFEKHLSEQLRARARLARVPLTDPTLRNDAAAVSSLCRQFRDATGVRFTVILRSGRVLGDSDEEPTSMENHLDRPEIQEALKGASHTARRFSRTLGRPMMYVAVPIERGHEIVAVVRTSVSEESISASLVQAYWRIGLMGVAIAISAAIVGWIVARRMSRPLEDLRAGAERFARGGLEQKLPMPDTLEFADLAKAMNRMAEELDARIRTVIRQRNEQEAILASMVEGVFAVDPEEHLISMNQAAAHLLGVRVDKAMGRILPEVVRNSDLLKFVDRALESPVPVAEEILLFSGDEERCLQAHGTVLRSEAQGEGIGALVVLHDVTQLRRLENVRREFVANVSHELRTPITSINGFVETLLGGAMHDPEDLARFLEIIKRQIDRLNNIIEDLLALSRIEQNEERGGINLDVLPLRPVLESAIQICRPQGEEKGIGIELECPEGLHASLNASLLEQAVVNLIDNAVKYSGSGGRVRVEATAAGSEIAIRVHDQGCGIPREHLPRVFERFYRVDKARSRKMGGTGLGLSIVKHLAMIHNGRVAVDSELGKGSTFTIFVPIDEG